MSRVWSLFALVLMALGWAAAAEAQTAAPRRIALLIGNADYNRNDSFDKDPKPWFVNDLKNPCNDVKLVKSALSDSFEIFDFCNIDHSEFGARVQEFAARTNGLPRNSIVFIYYAGHGMQHNGRMFMLPVLMQFNYGQLNAYPAGKQAEYFQKSANELSAALESLTKEFGVGVVVAMDNCRNNPLNSDSSFNQLVNIHTSANTLIQYATTPTDTTSDGVGGNSEYARVLAAELKHGGDIGDIFARTSSKIFKSYESGARLTYAVTNTGPAFAALRDLNLIPTQPSQRSIAVANSAQPAFAATPPPGTTPPAVATAAAPSLAVTPQPSSVAAAPVRLVAPAPTPAIIRSKKLIVADVPNRVRLDLIWCEGEGENANFDYAWRLGHDIARRRADLNVGRVQLVRLKESDNRAGGMYNVHRNLMRYDPSLDYERKLLVRLAASYPEGAFLPQAGIGVTDKRTGKRGPTHHYVSAFICRVPKGA